MSSPIIPTDAELTGDVEEIQIEQNHTRGPGWFLKVAYVLIAVFCFYYLFTHWDWKSDYEKQFEAEQVELEQAAH